jgi:hypothetical protein
MSVLLITILVGGFIWVKFFFRPLSNIYKYLGNPEIIESIQIINYYTDTDIYFTDTALITEFCAMINTMKFVKADSQIYGTVNIIDNYYICLKYNTGHQIQTYFPGGYLFRGMKDKGFVSPVFVVNNLTQFDEWFVNVAERTRE